MFTEQAGAPGPCVPTTSERRARRNARAFVLWTLVFAASFIGGRVFVNNGWFPDGALGIALSLVPIVPGGRLAFAAFLKLLCESDEMGRKVLTEGMVFGLGAVMIFWGSIQLPEHVWLPKVSADRVMAVLMFGFAAGIMRASWRHK